jgi:hypothetical protein
VQCKNYWAFKLEPMGVAWAGWSVDAAVSGRKPFRDRPAGARVNLALGRGDHLIISKLDRGFRNCYDIHNCLSVWTKRGVIVHFLDIGSDTGTPVGRMIVAIIAAVAEFERSRISERHLDSHAARRLKNGGRSMNTKAHLGYMKVGKEGTSGHPGTAKLIVNPEEMRLLSHVYLLHEGYNLPMHRVAWEMGKQPLTIRGRPWTTGRVMKCLTRFREYVGEGSQPDPTQALRQGNGAPSTSAGPTSPPSFPATPSP